MLFKKICSKLKIFWYSLFYGLKGGDILLSSGQKNTNESVLEVLDSGGSNVFKDILEENVTQEVEELRYSSYKIARESKRYKYIGNGKAKKKTESQLSERHVNIDESDNLHVILIQDNSQICEDVFTSLKNIDNKTNKPEFYDYNIKIIRDLYPRFRVEKYVNKLVLKESDNNYVIDLYCSKYPKQFSERIDKPFLTELKNIKDGFIKYSDVVDFKELSFITSNAWGVDDWFRFSFIDFEFYGVIEYDGSYILRFGCKSNIFMENILDKIFSASAEKKYEAKEAKKNNTIDFNVLIKNEDNPFSDDIILQNLENVKFSVDNNVK